MNRPLPLTSVGRDWLIVGHFGARNTGDDAMLTALLGETLRLAPATRFTVVCRDRRVPAHLQSMGVRAVGFSVTGILRQLCARPGVVLGGGTNFHDGHSGARYLRHLLAMARMAGVIVLARLLGLRIVAISAGIGPIWRWPTRALTWMAVRSCGQLVLRDQASLREAERLTPAARCQYAFDLAMLVAGRLPAPPPSHGKVIGLSPRALPGAVDPYEGWLGIIQALSVAMAADGELRVRVIPFSDGRETDDALGERLSTWLSREHPGRVERLPYDENPLVVLERIGACTYYVAGRYHAVLLGYLAGCRLWAIPYHRKVEDLSDEIGLGRRAVLRDVHRTPQSELDRTAASLLNGDPAFHATRPRAEAFESARGNLIAVGSH